MEATLQTLFHLNHRCSNIAIRRHSRGSLNCGLLCPKVLLKSDEWSAVQTVRHSRRSFAARSGLVAGSCSCMNITQSVAVYLWKTMVGWDKNYGTCQKWQRCPWPHTLLAPNGVLSPLSYTLHHRYVSCNEIRSTTFILNQTFQCHHFSQRQLSERHFPGS